jgi:NADH:ubiquinone oxidoreductase subunit 5 (subunit L)/multisubunit Na+/H+ antiporter MnhA subunit
MDGLVEVGVPLALVIRLTSVVATLMLARHAHAIFKGLLFLGAGSVVMATGTRQIEQFGGLLRRMPWTGLCFLVGALAIEPTFERYLYGPLVRGVVRMASGMKVLQAGSLHAYLAHVLVLAVILLMWLGGTT